jgi:hypothetical protein
MTRTKKPRGTNVVKAANLVKAGPHPANVLTIIAHAAADRRVQPEKMRLLLDMQKEIMAEQARLAFVRAFIGMQAAMPEIDKNGKIVAEGVSRKTGQAYSQKSLYATFDNIQRLTNPILISNGFMIWDEIRPGKETGVVVHTFLKHVDGHVTTSEMPLVLDKTGSKNDNQAAGSSVSYGKRYNRIALLNIVSRAPQDMDIDGRAAEAAEITTIDAEQTKTLEEAIDFCGVGITKFLDRYKIQSVNDLPKGLFNEALKSCANYAAKKAAANG